MNEFWWSTTLQKFYWGSERKYVIVIRRWDDTHWWDVQIPKKDHRPWYLQQKVYFHELPVEAQLALIEWELSR